MESSNDPRLAPEKIVAAVQFAETYLDKEKVDGAYMDSQSVPVTMSIYKDAKTERVSINIHDLDKNTSLQIVGNPTRCLDLRIEDLQPVHFKNKT